MMKHVYSDLLQANLGHRPRILGCWGGGWPGGYIDLGFRGSGGGGRGGGVGV